MRLHIHRNFECAMGLALVFLPFVLRLDAGPFVACVLLGGVIAGLGFGSGREAPVVVGSTHRILDAIVALTAAVLALGFAIGENTGAALLLGAAAIGELVLLALTRYAEPPPPLSTTR